MEISTNTINKEMILTEKFKDEAFLMFFFWNNKQMRKK